MELEEAYYEHRPLAPDKVAQAVDRLYRDGQAAGGKDMFPDVLAYSTHVALTESPTAADRGEVRALWSWRSQPEGALREVGHRFLVQACGESRGYQVLEDSPVGRKLESYELWDRNVQQALVRRFNLTEQAVQDAPAGIWEAASGQYAKAAEGQVAVFAAEIGAGSILGETEMPKVVGPEGVGKDAVGFPIEFPRQAPLPAEMYDLMADPAVRCDLRMEDYAVKGTTPLALRGQARCDRGAGAPAGGACRGRRPAFVGDQLRGAGRGRDGPRGVRHGGRGTGGRADGGGAERSPEARSQCGHPGQRLPPRREHPPRHQGAGPPRSVSASTHGVINPVIEAAPESAGMEH
ncbi:hypothetical protein AW27_014865 [Streptomyces sp. PCS3-D2]|uniref:hypothetical protein n=1 Tax=Streptomyces sp. PCS3-D2 TaxID=1460244 RepID=UPI00044E1221|nr:hypothetical protein [Streptomyces sp. PCS3-D2]WKV72695.1 hypothetical protein AW27_014865 [Streptomyces sp. PCS3-D2]